MTPEAILTSLSSAAEVLAFCDETEVTEDATSMMVEGIHMQAALIVKGETYPLLEQELVNFQAVHGLPHFHGNEIVNPGSKSTWFSVTMDLRLKTLDFLCEILLATADEIRYVHIPKIQYNELLEKAKAENVEVSTKQKVGTKKVFNLCMLEYLANFSSAVMLADKDGNGQFPRILKLDEANNLIGGGIVQAASSDVPGLQLADIGAYAVGRYIRRRDRIIEGNLNAFDEIIVSAVSRLNGRFISLLG